MGTPEVPPGPVSEDLFRPTLEDRPRPEIRPPGSRPWRLGSQVYVAFFGGVVAVTAIAFVNGLRLGMERRRRLLLLGVGAIGLAAGIAVAALTDLEGSTLRYIERGIALVTYGGLFLLQRTPDRLYHYYSGNEDDRDDYDSLWGPGLIAVIAGGLLQAAIIVPLAG